MHFHKRVLRIRLLQAGSRDRLILDAVQHHLVFCDVQVDDVHHAGMPRLDHGEGVTRQQGVLFEHRHRLVPMSVGLVMDMKFMV